MAVVAGCAPAPPPDPSDASSDTRPTATSRRDRAPRAVRQPGTFHAPPVHESSGLVRSRTHPGLLWTLNDSGNPPTLFLIDTLAQNPGFVVLQGVENRDWEALSAGPCGDERCLYVGDIGDNRSIRSSVRIYRVTEPVAEVVATRQAPVRDSLVVRYADGPEDAEAMVVTPAGDVAILTKGGRGRSTAYWIPAAAWDGDSVVAEPLGTLPFSTGFLLFRLVTDAALSADGAHLFVRTYRSLYRLGKRAPGDRLPMALVSVCDIHGLDPLGEGLAWWDDSTLVMTSELTRLTPAPVTLLECPA